MWPSINVSIINILISITFFVFMLKEMAKWRKLTLEGVFFRILKSSKMSFKK
jgi:hypothetical protein